MLTNAQSTPVEKFAADLCKTLFKVFKTLYRQGQFRIVSYNLQLNLWTDLVVRLRHNPRNQRNLDCVWYSPGFRE